MIFGNEAGRFAFVVVIVGLVFVVDFGFNVDELVTRVSASSFAGSSLGIVSG